MSKAEDLFHQLATEIPGVKEGKMFGSLCIKTPNGKSGTMFWKDCIIVKLAGDVMNEALALEGTTLFEPMEGRPMKEWAQIPYKHKNQWKRFAEISVEAARKLKK
ncbi:MAG TPA: hypothetical protein VG738_13445 [Chitinophagaceae bacterium]|nr:hypothetical protein [Chitinophagaceae bacterium]